MSIASAMAGIQGSHLVLACNVQWSEIHAASVVSRGQIITAD